MSLAVFRTDLSTPLASFTGRMLEVPVVQVGLDARCHLMARVGRGITIVVIEDDRPVGPHGLSGKLSSLDKCRTSASNASAFPLYIARASWLRSPAGREFAEAGCVARLLFNRPGMRPPEVEFTRLFKRRERWRSIFPGVGIVELPQAVLPSRYHAVVDWDLLAVGGIQSFRIRLQVRALSRMPIVQLIELLYRRSRPGVVYCADDDETRSVGRALTMVGFDTRIALDSVGSLGDRQPAMNPSKLVVTTTGRGFPVSQARAEFSVHFAMPSCMDTYLQEVPRIRRVDPPPESIILYPEREAERGPPIDGRCHSTRGGNGVGPEGAMAAFCQAKTCRHVKILRHHHPEYPQFPAATLTCYLCDVCLGCPRTCADSDNPPLIEV